MSKPIGMGSLIGSPASSGGIAFVQSASGTTDDGSAGLTVPFGAPIVSGAGTSAANGTYTLSGTVNGQPYFNLSGTDHLVSSFYWSGTQWRITSSGGAVLYKLGAGNPYQEFNLETGSAPAPTVACSSPVTAGNSVLMFNSRAGGAVADPTMVGGGGETLGQEAFDDDTPRCGIFGAFDLTGGETGVVSTGGAFRFNNTIIEVSGLADAPAESTASSTATSTTLAIGTITPTSANNLLTAIFAFNADVTVVGIANDVLVTGIGAGTYTYRGTADLGDGPFPFYNLVGQPTDGPNDGNAYCISTSAGIGWAITGAGASPLNDSTNESPVAFPYNASWTGSTVTEIPGWELVGTRTGGASVWQYVYQKIQTSADASNPTIVLSGSADIAGAAAAFGGV